MNLMKLMDVIAEKDSACVNRVSDALEDLGYKVFVSKDDFVFGVPWASRVRPVLLMAHIDTRRTLNDEPVVIERAGDLLANKNGILGADDRAGVFIILEAVKNMGVLPYVLFTLGEETGHTGARTFLKTPHPSCDDMPSSFYENKKIWEPYVRDIYAILQYDFRGVANYTTYGDSYYSSLCDVAESVGYLWMQGSTSDSLDISKTLDVAHLNLSCGYINAHTKEERLILPAIAFAVASCPRLIDKILYPHKHYRPDNYTQYVHTPAPPPKQEHVYTCDICGQKRATEFFEDAFAFVCKKCINRAGGKKKITMESVNILADQLEKERICSATNNLKNKPTCPMSRTHTEIYLLAHDVYYCLECNTFFVLAEGLQKTFFWKDMNHDDVWYFFNNNPKDVYKTTLITSTSFVQRCHICGDIVPKKHLVMSWDEDNNLVWSVCPGCRS